MRTFFSVAPDHETACKISQWSELCWPALGRRIPVQNYHITMAFLGDTDETSLKQIAQMLESFDHPSFLVNLNEVRYLASSDVLTIGPGEITEELDTLNKKCRQVARRIGARGGSKQFTPHLTLARKLNSPPPSALLEPNFSFVARSLELWSSVRLSQGAQYNTVGTWELN